MYDHGSCFIYFMVKFAQRFGDLYLSYLVSLLPVATYVSLVLMSEQDTYNQGPWGPDAKSLVFASYRSSWFCSAAIEEKHIDGLTQDCSNSSALALELLQFCVKPTI